MVPSVPAYAWEPKMHVFLAEEALQDAESDSKVTINRIDFQTGNILGELGSYQVDESLLQAIKNNRQQYRAGTFGPDAYPDILTGQQLIHPDPSDSGIFGGTNSWLQTLWNSGKNASDAAKAFTIGYLTHAIGDMYGHTFVNQFTGKPFTFTDPPENSVKHIVTDGYIAEKLDKQKLSNYYDVSIGGVEDFIYENLVSPEPGIISGVKKFSSIPYIYSTLRNALQQDLNGRNCNSVSSIEPPLPSFPGGECISELPLSPCEIVTKSIPIPFLGNETIEIEIPPGCRLANEGIEGINEKIRSACSKIKQWEEQIGIHNNWELNVACSAIKKYEKAWIEDIDAGLRVWPSVSHEVAKALFFNPDEKVDLDRAQSILQQYYFDHLLSMSGAPDIVGSVALFVKEELKAFTNAITPDFLVEPIRRLKDGILDVILEASFGKSKEELKEYLSSPETYFDQVMTQGLGQHVTRSKFDSDYLHISANKEYIESNRFPAAYNTVTMSKLMLLSNGGLNQLLQDLGANLQDILPIGQRSDTFMGPELALGFIQTLDGSNQWYQPSRMLLTKNCNVYRKVYTQIFMQEPGENIPEDLNQCSDLSVLSSEMDQENNPANWMEGAVNIAPANRVSQSFVPSRACLTAVEIGLKTGNSGRGGDQVTLQILNSGGQVIASTSDSIPEGFDGFWRFNLPGNGVTVTPGQPLTIQVEDTSKIVFFWKYQGNSPYAAGQAFFYGSPFGTNDMLFKTYVASSCRS